MLHGIDPYPTSILFYNTLHGKWYRSSHLTSPRIYEARAAFFWIFFLTASQTHPSFTP